MRHALAAAALLLAACDGLFTAELQIPSLRVTLPGQPFPASDTSDPADWCDPSAQSTPYPCVAVTLDYELGAEVPILNEENVTYDLRLTDVALTLTSTGAGDLSAVRSVAIEVLADPAAATSGFLLASYARPPGAAPTTIAVSGNANVDLGPYLDAGRLPVRVELVLEGGTPAFDADVTAGFSLEVALDYGAYL